MRRISHKTQDGFVLFIYIRMLLLLWFNNNIDEEDILMKKRMLAVFAAAIMAFSMAACSATAPAATQSPVSGSSTAPAASATPAATVKAEDPYGAYAQTVTINVGMNVDPTEQLPQGDTPDNNYFTRYVKDTLNIVTPFAWQAANNDYNQKVNLCIAANDIPDALTVNEVQLRAMVKAGMLEDLTDAYNKYKSPVMEECYQSTNGKALANVTIDGKMYALPNTNPQDDAYALVWIRQDWLDKLGLQAPKTIDDLKNIAKQFMDKDPGSNGAGKTIGIAGPQNGAKMYSIGGTFDFNPIFSAADSYPGCWIKDAQGKAVYGSILPETKTALGVLRDMYAQGLIDPQMGIRKDSSELVVNGQTGIFFGVWWNGYWPFPDAWKVNSKAN
jgi:putative aldouronate transport system substrate-binding protein